MIAVVWYGPDRIRHTELVAASTAQRAVAAILRKHPEAWGAYVPRFA